METWIQTKAFSSGLIFRNDRPPATGPCDVTQPICHFERSAATVLAIFGRMGVESRNPEDVYSAMLIQGVSARDCPGNLISPPPTLGHRSVRRHPTHLSFRAQRHNNVCHFRTDGRGVEKSRGCVFRHADSGSLCEGLSRRPDFRAPNALPGPYHVTQPMCHFERSAATMFAISG